MSHLQISLHAKYVDLSRVMSLILVFNTSEKIVTQTESGGVSHGECDGRQKSAETKQKLKLVIAMFPTAWDCSIPKSTLGVDYNGILVLSSLCAKWIQSQESGLHGWTIDSRGNESQAWVLVAIVHLIRTEVSMQSETQEVILIKHWRVQNIQIYYNKEKMQKKLLSLTHWSQRGPDQKQTQGQKQKKNNLCDHVRVLIQ